jgi:flagellar motor component MotA
MAEDFDCDDITKSIDALAEMAKTDPDEVRRIVEQEIEAHDPAPRHTRPFAEEWPDVAKAVGIVR